LDDLLIDMDARLFQASPLLIVGMHRSGTRLLDDILTSLGVFMGADRQADGESVTFMSINEQIFHLCGTFWNEPMPVYFVLSDPELLERATAVARDTLAALFGNYLGQGNLRSGGESDEIAPFGWKDPRNTFTLPVWRRIFPDARIIHVLRHGVDVAASLARRHGAALAKATGESVAPALTVIKDQGLGVLSSRRGWNLGEALTMWEQYVEKSQLESAELGDRALEIRFEDLLLAPEKLIPTIAQFCGVALPAPELYEAALARIDKVRAFAFRRDRKLVAFAEASREVLGRYGYAP
jgi:Sulfotransferase family